MKLFQVDIKKFRGFPKLKIDDFKDLNLIVGKNNCGKTSILEAIFLTIGISNPNLAISIDRLRGLFHDDREDFQFIFHNLSYSSNIEIDTKFINETQYRRLIIKPTFNKVKDIDIKSNILASNTTSTDKNIDGIEFDFSIKSAKQSKDKFRKATIQFTPDGVKVQQPNDYNESIIGIFLQPTTSVIDLYKRLDKILVKKAEDRFIRALQNIDNNIIGISLGAKNMIYFDIGIERLVPIQIMGDGTIKLLSYLATIANAEDGIVLIDEIENGFHFSILKSVWESIYDTAKLYNVQVFATTHSFECAKAFNGINPNKRKQEDSTRLYRIERENNLFRAIKYDPEVLESSFESNWEIR
ncbi:MAG: hypothetical protein B6I19_04505 [Bacteroidetes bacterium 4572_114]|nr:MAG: hypothetical protein B6I19_04505 [Bacteroidetes bacterium 4572_114]